MESKVHHQHALPGPHFGGRLTPEERVELQHWLDATEDDSDIGVRELAHFISASQLLKNAILSRARSALLGGLEPSSATHAVAILGVQQTRSLLRAVSDVSQVGPRPKTAA